MAGKYERLEQKMKDKLEGERTLQEELLACQENEEILVKQVE